jgi:hypothetical protein
VATPWIKVRTNVRDQREVFVVARRLGLARDHVVGLCVRVWAWADGQTTDGTIDSIRLEDIDAIVEHEGFAAALAEAGWLLVDKRGVIIPNFDRHNGESAKKRVLAAERKRRQRGDEAT